MIAEVADSHEILLGPEGWHEEEQVQLVPGARWLSGDQQWRAPLEYPVCVALQALFPHVKLGEELTAWGWRQYEHEQYLRSLTTLEDCDGHPDLLPRQRVGVRWLKACGWGILADEMRVGKAVQVATALGELGAEALPALIISAPGAEWQWQQELKRFGGLESTVVHGGAAQRRKQLHAAEQVVIVPWHLLRFHSKMAPYGSVRLETCTDCDAHSERKPATCHRCPKELNATAWKTVVADEGHRMANPKSQWTRCAWALRDGATHRWVTTGTPINGKTESLWPVLHFCNALGYKRKTQFIDRYAAMGWNAFGGLVVLGLNPATANEFRKAFDGHFLRRTLEQLGVRPLEYDPRYIELSTKERKVYDEMKKRMRTDLDDGTQLVAWSPLEKALRLMQMACATVRINEADEVELCEPSSKLDALDGILDDLDPEPVVVMAPWPQLLELAARRFEKRKPEPVAYSMIHGGVTGLEREEQKRRFRDGETRVFLASTGVASEGLNLMRARYLVFLQRPTSFIKNTQAPFRIMDVTTPDARRVVIDVVTRGAEERIWELQEENGVRFEEIVRDVELMRKVLSD